jgi:ATP-dependent 26S proteasome regulatory subunit
MLLKVRDAPWGLIGKNRVSVEADGPGLESGGLVRLANGDHIVAAVVDSVVNSGNNTICLDRDLRDSIGVDIGQNVRVEALGEVADAKTAHVSVTGDPGRPADAIRAVLQGVVVYEGTRVRHIFGDEDVLVVVRSTDPPGPVRIGASTLVTTAPSSEVGRLQPVYADSGAGINVMTERPAERFADVGGLGEIKRMLTENVIYAMQKDKARLFARMGYRPVRGVILYGPPGTGKTLLARATAGEAGACFISVPGSKFKNKWYGESERMIRDVFQAARENAPCIVFIDEIDAIAYARTGDHIVNVVNQLLVAIDEARDLDMFVIGATNALPMIDPALLRPGRLLPIEVGVPDKAAREQIFRVHLKELAIGHGDMARLLKLTDGYTGAQVEMACNKARMAAMRESGFSADTRLEMRHIIAALGDRSGRPEHLSEYT